MNQQPIRLPDYSPDAFVDREDEVGLVIQKAHPLLENRAVDRRTIIFIGERGTGKSWLLAHLRKLTELELTAFALNLADYATQDPVFAVMDILKQFSQVLGQGQVPGVTLAEMSRVVMENVRPRLEKQPLLLLVDWVYESDWKLLAALEDYWLGPLAVEPHVLIVMAGRGRPYPWKTPELRLKAEFHDLSPFRDVDTTAEQLRRQRKEAVDKAPQIHRLSGGNPLANFLLAAHENPGAALDQVIDGMLETVPSGRRRSVRQYLEALSVLRSFDEERIPTMLAVYYSDPSYRGWTHAQARRVREELVRWAFARWDENQGGYVMDAPTSALIEQYLQDARQSLWKDLHCAAFWLYTSWAEYPRARERWQKEVENHAGRLREAGFTPEKCSVLESQTTTITTAPAPLPM
jgi:hypothetical protein